MGKVVYVRGHWRELPSGRRVWVHDYTRRGRESKVVRWEKVEGDVMENGWWGRGLIQDNAVYKVGKRREDGMVRVVMERAREGGVKEDTVYRVRMGEDAYKAIARDDRAWADFEEWLSYIDKVDGEGIEEYRVGDGEKKMREIARDARWDIGIMSKEGEWMHVVNRDIIEEMGLWGVEVARHKGFESGELYTKIGWEADGIRRIATLRVGVGGGGGDGISELWTRNVRDNGVETPLTTLPVKDAYVEKLVEDIRMNMGRKVWRYKEMREEFAREWGLDAKNPRLLPYSPEMEEKLEKVAESGWKSAEGKELMRRIVSMTGESTWGKWEDSAFGEESVWVRDFTRGEKELMGEKWEWGEDDEMGGRVPGEYGETLEVQVKRGRRLGDDKVYVDVRMRYGDSDDWREVNGQAVMSLETWNRLRSQDERAWKRLGDWAWRVERINAYVQRYGESPGREIDWTWTNQFDPDSEEMMASIKDIMDAYGDYEAEMEAQRESRPRGDYMSAEEAIAEYNDVIQAIENERFGEEEERLEFVGATTTPGGATLHFESYDSAVEFEFTIYADGRVYWDYMGIDRSKRGKGIGTELKYKAEKALVARGIDTFTTYANISVGRYAWAVMGYDFAYVYAWRDRAELFLDMLEDEYGQDENMWAKIEKDPFIQRLRNGLEKHRNAKRYIHSWEFASWRAPDGKKFGKKFMLKHGSWDGVKTVDGPGWCIGCHYYELKGWLEEGDTHCGRCKD